MSNDLGAQARAAETPIVQPTSGGVDGARYMAPVAGALSAYPRLGAGYTAAPAMTASTSLDPSLPPQAYRGPSAGPASR